MTRLGWGHRGPRDELSRGRVSDLRILVRRKGALAVVVATAVAMGTVAGAQSTAPRQEPTFPVPGGGFAGAATYQKAPLPPTPAVTANGTVVEDVIARVNDQVITRTEYERAQQGLVEEAKQENWSPAEYDEKQRTLLRDMIDQQLLLSKGKELGITGDAETVRQLDEIRKRANLPDMEALQKAAEQQGVSFEDFKQNIRNQAITQQVVRDEVGRRINMTPSEEQSYYAAHAKDFEQPEQVHLSELLVPTPDNATDAQVAEAQTKADALEAKLKAGANFAELAKSSSGGPTASAGGDLGDFKRGTLGDVLEKATFALPAGQFTAPIRTRQGFVILRVDSHQPAGTPPLQQVESQVQQAVYMSQLQPALRRYLTQAREDAFLEIKPGFTDAGSPSSDSKLAFTAYAPPPLKKKVIRRQAAEQAKAVKAEQQLAAAREKLTEKQQARAAASGQPGTATVSTSRKRTKIRREKVRFGQAPRNALPNGLPEIVVGGVPSLGPATGDNGKGLGEAPGAAVGASTQSVTSISTGTGMENEEDPLAAPAAPEHKTRFAARESVSNEKKAQSDLARAEAKANKRPTAATPEESADEKVQAAPLGLAEPQPKKAKKHKRAKNEAKERLQDKTKPAVTPTTVAPTVNPTLGAPATGGVAPAPTADHTALPPATAPAPGAPPQGQPIPATTSTQPNAPASTVPQPRP